MSNRYDIIRQHYQEATPKIFKAAEHRVYGWYTPYTHMIDWLPLFTPIENSTWQAIRCFGMAPFYPQYPVGNYFIDFGNPILKLGIECDGAAFHQDKEKDHRRDENLFSKGWQIYRISGSDCVRPVSEDYYERSYYDHENYRYEILKEFYDTTIEGLLKALAIVFFDYKNYYDNPDEKCLALSCLDKRVSLKDKISHVPMIKHENLNQKPGQPKYTWMPA